ncbi:hypothetical protein D3C81_1355970 [compost metagenome]
MIIFNKNLESELDSRIVSNLKLNRVVILNIESYTELYKTKKEEGKNINTLYSNIVINWRSLCFNFIELCETIFYKSGILYTYADTPFRFQSYTDSAYWLYQRKIINKEQKNLLLKLFNIRNSLAHFREESIIQVAVKTFSKYFNSLLDIIYRIFENTNILKLKLDSQKYNHSFGSTDNNLNESFLRIKLVDSRSVGKIGEEFSALGARRVSVIESTNSVHTLSIECLNKEYICSQLQIVDYEKNLYSFNRIKVSNSFESKL